MRIHRKIDTVDATAFAKAARLLRLDRGRWARLCRRFLPLGERALLGEAARRTKLADFGDGRFREGLAVLLASYDADARLSLLGRIAARQDTLRLLETRLRLVEDRKRFPEIAAQEIRAPVFVTGLPRSGTSLLHNLLAQDPANRVAMSWEAMFPSPPPERAHYETDARIADAERAFRWFDRLVPGFRPVHAVGARLPQECIELMSYTFESPRFHATHDVTSYQAWLSGRDLAAAYGFHRQMLQHLQWRCPARRWVLKSPAHLFAFDAIFAVYPDARIIQTHRDPLEVLPSAASLTEVLRRAFSDRTDPRTIGDEVARRWAEGVNRAMAAREAHVASPDRFCDVRYRDLVADPMATVRRIYAHHGLAWTDAAEAAMARYLAANPQHKHGAHDYTLDRFGLVPEDVRRRFRAYSDRFLIELEAA